MTNESTKGHMFQPSTHMPISCRICGHERRFHDGDTTPSPAVPSPQERIAQLRARLTARVTDGPYHSCRRNSVRCVDPDDRCWFCEAREMLDILAALAAPPEGWQDKLGTLMRFRVSRAGMADHPAGEWVRMADVTDLFPSTPRT